MKAAMSTMILKSASWSLRVPLLTTLKIVVGRSEFSSSTIFGTDTASVIAEAALKPEMRHFMIVGLGNHGYDDTRHNVGMKAVDRLAARLQLDWQTSARQHGGFVCSTVLRNGSHPFKVTLLKPKTFMNISGASVAKAANMLSVSSQDIYLIHDELDRGLGKFHIKERGSAGGHNGVLSCISCLRSDDMPRVRIGISRPTSKSEIIPYVLSKFSDDELAIIDVTIDHAVSSLLRHIEKRISETVT